MSARDDFPTLADRELFDTTGETTLILDELDVLRDIKHVAEAIVERGAA